MKINEIKENGVYKVDAMVRKDESGAKSFFKGLFTKQMYQFAETAKTGGVQTFILKKNNQCEIYKGNLSGDHTLVDSFELSQEEFKEWVFEKRKVRRNGLRYKFLKVTFEEL